MASKLLPSSGSAFDIDVEAGVVFSRFFGSISPTEVLSHLVAVGADSRFRPGMSTLADIRAARVEWGVQDIVEFRIMLFDTFQNRITGRWALLTDARAAAGMAKLVENLFLRVDTRLFESIDHAMGWLRESAPADSAWSQYWRKALAGSESESETFNQV